MIVSRALYANEQSGGRSYGISCRHIMPFKYMSGDIIHENTLYIMVSKI